MIKVLIIGAVLLVMIIIFRIYSRKKRLKSRKNISKEQFIEYFEAEGFLIEWIQCIYVILIKKHKIQQTLPLPEDDLHLVLELDDFEDEIILIEVFKKLKINKPSNDQITKLNQSQPIFNVRYILSLIRMINKTVI